MDINNENITLFDQPNRYGSEHLCQHVIGYLDAEGHGVDGLERVFDDVLSESTKRVSVRYQVNALGQALTGGQLEVIEEGNNQKGVVLTIDKDIQRIAETAARKGIEKRRCGGDGYSHWGRSKHWSVFRIMTWRMWGLSRQ